jgi:4-amino-4-deoxy-L-arabinose transferase-like glycosyltransferase
MAAVSLAALVGSILVLAAVPPVDRDALTHHLAVPKLYLKHGGLVELPAISFSYYPMNLDLLYLLPLYFGNDILPKYIHFAFALATGGLVFGYLRQRLKRSSWALLGALMFLSLPVIVKLSITVYVDLGLIFFSTAALLQILQWARAGMRIRQMMIAGLLAGLCLGTKPNGLLVVFLLALCVPFAHRLAADAAVRPAEARRENARRPLTPLLWAMVFTATAALVYSPWMIRNAAWTGNPFYPMGESLFGPSKIAASAGAAKEESETEGAEGPLTEKSDPLGPFGIRRLVYGESLAEILLVPVRIFLQGRDDDPRYFDGRLNPCLLLLPLFAFINLRGKARPADRCLRIEKRVMSCFALAYLLFAFFLTDMRVRYVGPIIPPLVILACIGLHDAVEALKARSGSRLRPAAIAVALMVSAAFLAPNAFYISRLFTVVEPLGYLAGGISRDAYIERHRPEYAAISYANRNLPEDARILALFNGKRIYYSDREMICSLELFTALVLGSDSAESLSARLRRAGISHVLIGVERFNHWACRKFEPAARRILELAFQEQFREVFQQHGYALFEVNRTRPESTDPVSGKPTNAAPFRSI